jgi:hypothetical protein
MQLQPGAGVRVSSKNLPLCLEMSINSFAVFPGKTEILLSFLGIKLIRYTHGRQFPAANSSIRTMKTNL